MCLQLMITFIIPPSEMQAPKIAFKVARHTLGQQWGRLGSAPRMLLAAAGMLLSAAVPLHILAQYTNLWCVLAPYLECQGSCNLFSLGVSN